MRTKTPLPRTLGVVGVGGGDHAQAQQGHGVRKQRGALGQENVGGQGEPEDARGAVVDNVQHVVHSAWMHHAHAKLQN